MLAYKVVAPLTGSEKKMSISPARVIDRDGYVIAGSLIYIPGEITKSLEGSMKIFCFRTLECAIEFAPHSEIWVVESDKFEELSNEIFLMRWGIIDLRCKTQTLRFTQPPPGTVVADSIKLIKQVSKEEIEEVHTKLNLETKEVKWI